MTRKVVKRLVVRLLNETEAAHYCGAPTVEIFREVCPLRPLDLYGERYEPMYDRLDLDGWIKVKKESAETVSWWDLFDEAKDGLQEEDEDETDDDGQIV